jgi:DNA polymerase-3 subunit delta
MPPTQHLKSPSFTFFTATTNLASSAPSKRCTSAWVIQALPFLAERRLVVLNHAQVRLNGSGAQSRYESFMNRLPETTALVLAIPDVKDRGKWKSVGANHWLRKWVQKVGGRAHLQECELPPAREMPAWIRSRAKELGGQFHPAAAIALAGHVVNDTRLASLEIEKLLTYVDFQRPVEAEDVEMLTTASAQTNVFDMVDAMAQGQKEQALRALHGLMEDQEPVALFGMIIRQFRLLLMAREILAQGGTASNLTTELNLHSFVADKLYRQAQRFNLRELEEIYHRLLEVDEDMKTSRSRPDVALDVFIAGLAG